MESCAICWEDLDDLNKVEFTEDKAGLTGWSPSTACRECIDKLLQTQYQTFVDHATNADCERTMRHLIARGPPVYIYDENIFPASEGRDIVWLRLAATNERYSGKLKGAVEGQDRLQLWDFLRQFVPEKSA